MSSLRIVNEKELVGSDTETPPKPLQFHPTPERDDSQALNLLLLALRTVSQRFVVAVSNSLTLLGLGSVGALAWKISESPTIPQLVELGLFGLFVLALRYVWRK